MLDKLGFNGFIWFFGIVEDIDDPLRIGRARVRIYNIHSPSEALVPKDDLPWAHVILPVTSAGFNEYGASPTGLVINSTVFGFFADGIEQQQPMILGTLPGIPQKDQDNVDPKNLSLDNHDVSRLARGINKLAAVKDSNRAGVENVEPSTDTTFRAIYPYNKVYETPAGHVIEIDDSAGAERIHIYHNSGSYTEWSPGRKVDKTNGTSIEIDMLDKVVRVKGDYLLDIDGNYQTTVGGNMVVDVKGSILIQSGTTIDTKSKVSTTIDSGLTLSTKSTVSTTVESSGFMAVRTGTYVDVNVGAAATFVVGGLFDITTSSLNVKSGQVIGIGAGDVITMGAPQIFLN